MAYHFHAGQYDAEFGPRRLGNWERARWAPSRARAPGPRAPALADINGRLLPGARRNRSSAWGHSLGTWDLPRRITREIADKLAKEPPDDRFRSWLKPQKKAAAEGSERERGAAINQKTTSEPYLDEQTGDEIVSAQSEEAKPKDKSINPHSEEIRLKNEEDANLHGEKIRLKDENRNEPYVPGSMTEVDKQHESYNFLVKKTKEETDGPQESNEDRFWREVAEGAEQKKLNEAGAKQNSSDKDKIKEPDNHLKLPKVIPSMGYYHARKMHMEDLQHQPLPDTLAYRYLQSHGKPETEIVVKPYAIGWKGYGASGPTGCTKMRVHRPKTSKEKDFDHEKENVNNTRPATTGHDMRALRKNRKPMTQMDLAICWDFRPPDTRDEPKRPIHIDGTNGSQAPAVFTLVHTPKAEPESPVIRNHTNPIFTQGCKTDDMGPQQMPYFEKDMTKDRRKDSCEVQNCPQHDKNKNGNDPKNNNTDKDVRSRSSSGKSSSFSVKSARSRKCDGINGCGTSSEISSIHKNRAELRPDKLKPIKQAWSNTDTANENNNDNSCKDRRNSVGSVDKQRPSIESYDKTSLARGKLFQSSPNLSQGSIKSKDSTAVNVDGDGNTRKNNNNKGKYCLTCNGTTIPTYKPKQKDEYKFAFKAGNPNSIQSSTGDNKCSSTDSKNLKIPKMRDPYARRTYSIPTLAPPFSLWRDASNSGYPEHWRLASVYQHAYKPIDQRRKPLIASVFQ